jgi:release factor glutamine methyltransferase
MSDFAHPPHLADSHPLKVGRITALARFLGKVMFLRNRLRGYTRYDDYRVERIRGAPFLIIPSVFNPKLLRTGEFFASQINATLVRQGWDVLDMGTGSGVCAVLAAQHARHVVAVDINPAAVRCATINALLNQVENKIDVRCSDLFAGVQQQRFDLILFNPPFERGPPSNDRDRAWRATDVAERFAADLAAHLKPEGFALVLLSTFGDANAFLHEFHKRDFVVSMLAERQFINERLTIFKLSASPWPL